MGLHTIQLKVNGRDEMLHVPAQMTLLRLLREHLSLTGTKNGCEAGECGACTVLLDGQPVNSCMVLAVECDGCEVMTVEGLSENGSLEKLQNAFADANAIQCGFCTPGMLISAYALLQRNAKPSESDIREALVGNLCRCTGYERIIKAVGNTTRKSQGDRRAS
jgi:aerobic-type carbon monoxide dehydrogenase small subunit (CoxS/CutS family)